MNLYFDTSALVKFFHDEPGTDKVTLWIEDPKNVIWLLSLARLEFVSVLFRRYRNHEITEQALSTAISGFEQQIALFNVQPLGQPVLEEAESLIKEHGKVSGLRTLDALHLGAFILIADPDWLFVSADNNLCKVVSDLGYRVLNPLDE